MGSIKDENLEVYQETPTPNILPWGLDTLLRSVAQVKNQEQRLYKPGKRKSSFKPVVARLNDPGVQKVNSSVIEITTVATVRFVRVPNMRIQPSAKQAIEF